MAQSAAAAPPLPPLPLFLTLFLPLLLPLFLPLFLLLLLSLLLFNLLPPSLPPRLLLPLLLHTASGSHNRPLLLWGDLLMTTNANPASARYGDVQTDVQCWSEH